MILYLAQKMLLTCWQSLFRYWRWLCGRPRSGILCFARGTWQSTGRWLQRVVLLDPSSDIVGGYQ